MRRRTTRRDLLRWLPAAALVGVACRGDQPSSGANQPAGGAAPTKAAATAPARQAAADTLVVAWSGDLNNMDPPFSLVEWNRELALNVYEPLLQYVFKPQADGTLVWDGLEVAPALAESWVVDGATVTFKLRRGARFQPSGNEVTADDVKWSFERLVQAPGSIGKFNANLAGLFDPAKQVEAVDPATVRITFSDAQGNALLLPASLPSLRFPQFGVIDSRAARARATADDPWALAFLKENVVGAGPYVVERRTAGTETVLRAAPGYSGKPPGFARVILRVVKEPADVVALLRKGEVDVSTGLGTRELDALQDAGFAVYNAPIPNIVRLDLALEKAPLDRKDVRQALAQALPYDAILKTVYSNRGSRAYSYVNPRASGYSEAFKAYTGDQGKARDLLQKAGLGGGFALDLFYDSGVPGNEDTGLLIQDALRKLNVTINLKPEPTTQFSQGRAARARGESVHQGLALNQAVIWLDDPDPSTDLWLKSNGVANATGYKNSQLDELHARFRFASDARARRDAYERMQQLVADDVPLIPLVVTGRNAAVHPSITGVSFTADPHNRYWTLAPKR